MTAVIKKAWAGDERLSTVFWYYAFLGTIIVSVVSNFALKVADSAGIKAIGAVITLGAVIAAVAYNSWIVVALWRCAPNVERRLWGTIARVYAVAQAALIAYWIFEFALWLGE